MSRTERRATTVQGRIDETAARRAARWGGVLPVTRETPELDAARAEFHTTRPTLAAEPLAQRLERAIPGAWVAQTFKGAWCVYGPSRRVGYVGKLLAAGASEREAIEKAIALWGSR